MKKIKQFKVQSLATVLTIFLLSLFMNVQVSAQFVHTNGTKIVDGNGNELFLTGMNLGNWLLWEGYLMMGDFNYRTHTQFFNGVKTAFGNDLGKAIEFEHQWRLNYVTNESIRELKALGFNSVRVPFHYNMFWDYNSNSVSDRGFQYIDRLIQYCRNHNVYILLDMHAAPGYQNPGDHCDNMDSNASQPRTSVHFWDGNNVDIAAQVWKHIANKYKNEAMIWGYDLINEPVPQEKDKWRLLASMATMRNAIREVDNNHIIVAEGSWWGSDMSTLDWTNSQVQSGSGINYRWDNNLVYQTHHYSNDVAQLNDRKNLCNRLNVPLILGEYGESDMGNLRNMTNWCIDNNVGYFPWSFKKMSHDKCLWTIHPNNAYNQLKSAINSNSTGPGSLYGDMINFCQNNISNGSSGISWHQDFYDAVKNNSTPPPPTNTCDNAQAISLPGKLEAENYCAMHGIQTENCSEGGLNIGWVDEGDWLDFKVNVASGGEYTVNFRVAAEGSGSKSVQLRKGSSVLGTVNFQATGGWQTWSTKSATVNLSSGIQILRVYFPVSGLNLNWIELTKNTSTGFSQRIEAENSFESFGVQTEACSEGGLNVGWLDSGDWMAYEVDIPITGTYTIEYRVASPNGGGSLTLEAFGGGATYGAISIPSTGGWQAWTTIKHNVTLNAGKQDIAVAVTQGGWNFNWLSVTQGLKSATSIEEKKPESGYTVYPNPAIHEVSITGLTDQALIEVYDIAGRKVAEDYGTSVNVEHLRSGVHFVRFNHINVKFMKQ